MVACATADVELIAHVADRLRERDYAVELLGGAEADELALTLAAERVGRHGLYVLVRSPALGRAEADGLRSLLRRHEISFGRILTLTLEGGSSPPVLEDRILTVLLRLSSRGAGAPAAAAQASSGPSTAQAASPDGDPHVEAWANSLAGRLVAEALESEPSATSSIHPAGLADPAAGLEEEFLEVLEDEDAGHRAQEEPPKAPSSPPSKTGKMLGPPLPPPITKSFKPPQPKSLVEPSRSPPAVAKPTPHAGEEDDTVDPDMAIAIERLGIPAVNQRPGADFMADEGSAPRALAALREIDHAASEQADASRAASAAENDDDDVFAGPRPAAEPVSSLSASPRPAQSAARPLIPVEQQDAPIPPPLGSSSEREDGLGGALRGPWTATVLEWGGTVKRQFQRAVPRTPRELLEADWWSRNRAVAGATLGGVALLIVAVAGLSGSDDERSAGEVGKVAAANIAAAEPSPESAKDVEDAVPAPSEPEVVVVAPSEPDVAAGTVFEEAQARPASEDAAPVEAVDSGRVVAALKSRKIRAMDTLLVTTKARDGLPLVAAEEHCASLVVEALGGWRLPHVGELHSLNGAKILGRSMYWSSTIGDAFGDRAMVLSGRTGGSSPVSVGSTSVSTLCVRPRS